MWWNVLVLVAAVLVAHGIRGHHRVVVEVVAEVDLIKQQCWQHPKLEVLAHR